MADTGPIWNIQTRMHRKYLWTRPRFMADMVPHGLALRQFPVMVECPIRIFPLRHTASIICVSLRNSLPPTPAPAMPRVTPATFVFSSPLLSSIVPLNLMRRGTVMLELGTAGPTACKFSTWQTVDGCDATVSCWPGACPPRCESLPGTAERGSRWWPPRLLRLSPGGSLDGSHGDGISSADYV